MKKIFWKHFERENREVPFVRGDYYYDRALDPYLDTAKDIVIIYQEIHYTDLLRPYISPRTTLLSGDPWGYPSPIYGYTYEEVANLFPHRSLYISAVLVDGEPVREYTTIPYAIPQDYDLPITYPAKNVFQIPILQGYFNVNPNLPLITPGNMQKLVASVMEDGDFLTAAVKVYLDIAGHTRYRDKLLAKAKEIYTKRYSKKTHRAG